MNKHPNTKIDQNLLSHNIILCCGEDEHELESAFSSIGLPGKFLKFHKYRCYKLWKFENATIILSGIGTGCLEPLLFEILSFNIINKIILIGTAANLPKSNLALGTPCIINKAKLAGTPLDCYGFDKDLTCKFNITDKIIENYTEASILSTDFYYGFSSRSDIDFYLSSLNHVKELADRLFDKYQLLDMEVAQFYYFCSIFNKKINFEYIAIKGPANDISNQDEQTDNSQEMLLNCIDLSYKILNIVPVPSFGNIENNEFDKEKIKSASDRLMAQVKLFWTIQISTASVLGFLSAKVLEYNDKNDFIFPMFIFSSFLLVLIGCMYNLVGNYYTRIERQAMGQGLQQESVVTLFISIIYLIFSFIIGGTFGSFICKILCKKMDFFDNISFVIVFSSISLICNYYLQRNVFKKLYEKNNSEYNKYAENLQKFFMIDKRAAH